MVGTDAVGALQVRDRAAELFGEETVVRGRLLARILGKTIKLN